MAVKKWTSKEIIWHTIAVSKKQNYLITSDLARTTYHMWAQSNGNKPLYIDSAPTPASLYQKIK